MNTAKQNEKNGAKGDKGAKAQKPADGAQAAQAAPKKPRKPNEPKPIIVGVKTSQNSLTRATNALTKALRGVEAGGPILTKLRAVGADLAALVPTIDPKAMRPRASVAHVSFSAGQVVTFTKAAHASLGALLKGVAEFVEFAHGNAMVKVKITETKADGNIEQRDLMVPTAYVLKRDTLN